MWNVREVLRTTLGRKCHNRVEDDGEGRLWGKCLLDTLPVSYLLLSKG